MGKVLSDACLTRAENLAAAGDLNLSNKELVNFVIDSMGKVGQEKRFTEMGMAYALNGMLSAPSTLFLNLAGLATNAVLRPLIHLTEAGLGAARLTKSDKTAREAMHMFMANFEGMFSDIEFFKAGFFSGRPLDIQTSLHSFARAYNTDEAGARSQIINAIQDSFVALRRKQGDTRDAKELVAEFRLARKANNDWDDIINDFLDESYDYISGTFKSPFLDKVIKSPTRVSVAIDEYAKARYRRMKIVELASRKAAAESGGDPAKYNELFNKYKKETLWGLDARAHRRAKGEGWDEDFKEMQKYFAKLQQRVGQTFGEGIDDFMPYTDMREFTLEHTFQSRVHGNMQKLLKARDENAGMAVASALFFPFVKTPWNIVKQGSTYIPIIPIRKGMRPSNVRYTTTENGKKKAEVIYMSNEEIAARQVIGAGVFMSVMSAVASGYATGSARDAQQRQQWKDQGKPELSIRIGDNWYSYAKFEPIATVMGLAADLMEAGMDYYGDFNKDLTATEVAMQETLAALKGNIFDKSFMEGWAQLFSIMDNPRNIPEEIANRLTRIAIPSISNYTARALDDKERQSTTILEKAQQRIPLAREELPEDFGAYGGAREAKAIGSRLTGIDIKDAVQDRTQAEAQRVGLNIQRPSAKLKRVKLSNEQLAEYRRLSNEYTTQLLNNTISSQFYAGLPKSLQRRMLEEAARRAKAAASKQMYGILMQQDPEFGRKWWNEMLESKGLEDVLPRK